MNSFNQVLKYKEEMGMKIKKGVIFIDNSGNERFEVRRVFKKHDVVLLYSIKSGVLFKMSLKTLTQYLDDQKTISNWEKRENEKNKI